MKAELRAFLRSLRVLLDLGGPIGVLIYKLDGSLDRRVRDSVARDPSWREALRPRWR